MTRSIIEFERVVAGYSPSLTILNETTLDARAGEITLLIGPNGAGKSTVLKTLFGMLTPRSGEIRFEGSGSTAGHRVISLQKASRSFHRVATCSDRSRSGTISNWAESRCRAGSSRPVSRKC